jgi:hypothetical protein
VDPVESLKDLEKRNISPPPSHYNNYITPAPQKLIYKSSSVLPVWGCGDGGKGGNLDTIAMKVKVYSTPPEPHGTHSQAFA